METIVELSAPGPDAGAAVAAENSLVYFTDSLIHGMGGFARCRIPAGTVIIEYVGERIDKAEAQRRCEADNRYIFCINETWDIDGSVAWNPARFINHSCSPNCEAEMDEEAGRIWIKALRDIVEGEELSYNYGYDIADCQDHPCRCGAPECVGFMVAEEYFARVRKQQFAPA